jgi:hypothetical protein
MHPAEKLWQKHEPPSYPRGVLQVPHPIVGTAFFPGGFGLWNPKSKRPLPDFPIGGVMILGHDFHSEAGYHESVARGAESLQQPTWRNLLNILGRAEIAPENCFFTNVYMGLRAGTSTTGVFPGASDSAFVAHCQRFLLMQLSVQRPSVIITLGLNAPRVLAPLSSALRVWEQARGFRSLNNNNAVIPHVVFDGITDYVTTAVALIHPSLRHASLRHREYRGLRGDAAEITMLKDAIEFPRGRLPNTG